MYPMPETPPLDDAPAALLDGGHLWLLELLDGLALRFQLDAGGVVRFADERRPFAGDDPPLGYGLAVRRVRERLDREALRAAVDDVRAVTFVGVAPVRRSVAYDWDRTPAFLGVDVWNGEAERWLPPDRVEQVYDRLGLDPVNALRKEVRAVDFDPDRFSIPDSAWRDDPAFGALVRNKRGGRAVLSRPPDDGDDGGSESVEPQALVDAFVADGGLDRADRGADGRRTGGALFDRAWAGLTRERYRRFVGREAVDPDAVRAALATATNRYEADGGR